MKLSPWRRARRSRTHNSRAALAAALDENMAARARLSEAIGETTQAIEAAVLPEADRNALAALAAALDPNTVEGRNGRAVLVEALDANPVVRQQLIELARGNGAAVPRPELGSNGRPLAGAALAARRARLAREAARA